MKDMLSSIKAWSKRHQTGVVISIIVLLILFLPLTMKYTVLWMSNYRPLAEFFITWDLHFSCGEDKKGCNELRPLPSYLVGKKLVIDNSSFVEFAPYEPQYRETADIDVLGFLDVSDTKSPGETLVNPTDQKYGYLQNKEYFPVRAVYHYKCSYCIDSSDNAYVVFEDKDKNRYIVFLNDLSTTTVSWDKQPLLLIGNGWNLIPVQ